MVLALSDTVGLAIVTGISALLQAGMVLVGMYVKASLDRKEKLDKVVAQKVEVVAEKAAVVAEKVEVVAERVESTETKLDSVVKVTGHISEIVNSQRTEMVAKIEALEKLLTAERKDAAVKEAKAGA